MRSTNVEQQQQLPWDENEIEEKWEIRAIVSSFNVSSANDRSWETFFCDCECGKRGAEDEREDGKWECRNQ